MPDGRTMHAHEAHNCTSLRRAALQSGFAVPTQDLHRMMETLGSKFFTGERTLVQYVAWSIETGLVELLHELGCATVDEVAARTPLTERGADSLLGVLCATGLASRSADGRYALTATSCEYLLRSSPFFVGDQLRPDGPRIPRAYLHGNAAYLTRIGQRLAYLHPRRRFGARVRIANQHARNLSATVAAVRSGAFADVRCLVDIAGGSGTFAIPFALEYPDKRVIFTELPRAVRNVRRIFAEHHLESRIEAHAMDALKFPWPIPDCDGIFIGNFLHGSTDEVCRRVCQQSFERLQPGGRLGIHEMVWNERRDGPLITALWHATMRAIGPGCQRTVGELFGFLRGQGFVDLSATPTSGAFHLICGRKPG